MLAGPRVTAIAGYVSFGDFAQPDRQCSKILAGLGQFGGHDEAIHGFDNICFGRILQAVLPEDDYDRQPLNGAGGRYLLVADARIDNRSELSERLGIEASIASLMSDADLLLAAWEKWQIHSLSHLLGDVAVAVWDVRLQRLTLARTAVALKPLFYSRGPGFVAFASMPHGLHALGEIPKKLDFEELAAIAAGLPLLGSSTCFAGITMVRHGHAVELSRSGESVIRTWDLDSIRPASVKSSECGEALRAELERAVRAQLRGRGGPVAAQLSSGRDSNAVTGTAARLLHATGGRLIALTGAPRIGFSVPALPNRLADESFLAAETARHHENITHVVCRTKPCSIGDSLRRLSRAHFGPMLNPTGVPWNIEVAEEASRRGSTILLIGSTGNFSISAGGASYLRHIWDQNGLAPWWRMSRRIGGSSWRKWREVGQLSFGPLLPESVYRLLMVMGNRRPGEGFGVPVLRRPFRDRAEALLADYYPSVRPPKDYYAFRRKMLFRRDNAEKMNGALWGLDLRDPSGDRRLIELCLSFPADQLVSADAARPAYEAAFADRIPADVLKSRQRGVQGADWFEIFDPGEVRTLFRNYRENSAIRELFDFSYIERLLAQWPADGSARAALLPAYRNELLGALAIAEFMELHCPN